MEGISDREIITRLQEVESSLWETLLENRRFDHTDISELIQNPVYMAAYQRVKNSDQLDHQPSPEDKPILSLYDRINEMLDAIPAIQYMQFLDDLETSKSHFDYILDTEIQESVRAVLERARPKLYDVRMEYASFGETSGDQAGPTHEEKELNRELGLQLRELLSIVPATSLSLEAPRRQSDGSLERMRQAAQEAAGAFGGAVQTLINRVMGGGRDRTQ